MEIPSETDPSKSYVVMVDPHANRSELHACSCLSYKYKGACKHQKLAHQKICGWCELDGPAPSEEDVKAKLCPKCKGPMVRAIYEIDEESEK